MWKYVSVCLCALRIYYIAYVYQSERKRSLYVFLRNFRHIYIYIARENGLSGVYAIVLEQRRHIDRGSETKSAGVNGFGVSFSGLCFAGERTMR